MLKVKSPDGSYYCSGVQLAIWLEAGFENTRQLKELAAAAGPAAQSSGGYLDYDNTDQLSPCIVGLLCPGIAVVDQVWYIHLATNYRSVD